MLFPFSWLYHVAVLNNLYCFCFYPYKVFGYHDACKRTLPLAAGMLPLALHVDGAEFYSNSEYLCWSMASVLSSEHVFDSKFPVAVLPHSSMLDEGVKAHVHATVGKVLAWSLRCASTGVAPLTGAFDEPLLGERAKLGGQQLANGWKGCFFGFRFDEKARKEVNAFTRSYQHSLICMRCMAQRLHKNWVPALNYKNFHRSAAHRMTQISQALS